MAFLPPIPIRMLPDTMAVRVPDGRGGLSDPVEVANVRFDRAESVCDDEHRSADAGSGVVFVDAMNSVGAFDVPAGSRVEIGGASMFVRKVKRLEAVRGQVHHWELEVS